MARRRVALIFNLLVVCIAAKDLLNHKRGRISNKVLVQYEGTFDEVTAYASSLGLEFKRKVFADWYVLTIPLDTDPLAPRYVPDLHLSLSTERKRDKRVKFIEQEKNIVRKKRNLIINDEKWSQQWHLHKNQTPSMKVYDAWENGFTGDGVTVSIIDDGIDVKHPDLIQNYNASLSYDYVADTQDPSHKHRWDWHGTNCAGMIGAANNTDCVIGIAYEVSMAAVRLLDVSGEIDITASDEALSLTHKFQYIDIYSNSWGPDDDGAEMGRLPKVVHEAFELAIKEGRNGKGVIYTWASGNGYNADDCNADSYTSSVYTIGIAAVNQNGSATYYSEPCASLLAATFSGGGLGFPSITTTGANDTCVDDFLGTSAACPAATGILALTLQANPDLTWRDIQHMIVEFSDISALNNTYNTHGDYEFYTNGAGKQVSIWYGFGLMDAMALVKNAPTWSTVPPRLSCTSGDLYVDRASNEAMEFVCKLSDCFVQYLEHVEITLTYNSSYRGNVELYLLSPMSTESKIFSARPYDSYKGTTFHTFMSVHYWGENPNGEWVFTLFPVNETDMHLFEWRLDIFGTATKPLDGIPAEGTFGSPCNTSSSCTSFGDGGCLKDSDDMCDNICISCKDGYHSNGDFCEKLCPPLISSDGSYIVLTNESDVLIATYTCYYDFGYELAEGNDTRTCGSDGIWTGMEPSCELVDCGPVGDPGNGSVSFENTTFDSIATYTCDDGYAISDGDQERSCLQDKQWSGTEPTCSPDCGPLLNPEHGNVSFTDTFEGSEAMYICNEGYALTQGAANRTCGSDGLWLSFRPVCLIDCGPPKIPKDGLVSFNETFQDSEAKYKCKEGYVLADGESEATCGKDGKWSSMPPICLIDCGEVTGPEYGNVSYMYTYQGSEALYTCMDGYLLSTIPARRICHSDGQWSSFVPQCFIDCGDLDEPDNGMLSLTSTYEGSNAVYVCSTGFSVSSGDMYRICNSDGMWTGKKPLCEIDCGRLENPENGMVWWKHTTRGSEAVYVCKDGYTLETGNTKRRCDATGNWIGNAPTCALAEAMEREENNTTAVVIVVGAILGGLMILIAVIICVVMYYKKDKKITAHTCQDIKI